MTFYIAENNGYSRGQQQKLAVGHNLTVKTSMIQAETKSAGHKSFAYQFRLFIVGHVNYASLY